MIVNCHHIREGIESADATITCTKAYHVWVDLGTHDQLLHVPALQVIHESQVALSLASQQNR